MNGTRCVLVLLLLVGSTGGCMQAARVFLDLPESAGEETAERPTVSPGALDSILQKIQADPELPPPAVEGVSDLDSLLALLPRSNAGGIDWTAAWETGVIRPRAYPPGGKSTDSATVFPFDFYLGDADGPDAYFAHSVHVQWTSCGSCHPTVYARRGESLPASSVHGTASCATCHGPVAFSMQSCERCHEAAADLPPARLEPTTLGRTYQLLRIQKGPATDSNDPYGGMGSYYEPASFPHGRHRLRYQCRACHEQPFPMRNGAVTLNEEEAHSTRGCGYCHNGKAAFDISMSSCYRCHQEESAEGGDR